MLGFRESPAPPDDGRDAHLNPALARPLDAASLPPFDDLPEDHAHEPALSAQALERLRRRRESVIQDVDIPLVSAQGFLAQLHAQVGITPVWVCPFVATTDQCPLYRLRMDTPYVNFGFWDSVRSREPDGHYNAIVERLVVQHEGKKSLYSRSTFDEQTFWTLYDRPSYEALKRKYDPSGRFPGLYEKTVGRG